MVIDKSTPDSWRVFLICWIGFCFILERHSALISSGGLPWPASPFAISKLISDSSFGQPKVWPMSDRSILVSPPRASLTFIGTTLDLVLRNSNNSYKGDWNMRGKTGCWELAHTRQLNTPEQLQTPMMPCVPNIVVPWNGETVYIHCCNFYMVKPKCI